MAESDDINTCILKNDSCYAPARVNDQGGHWTELTSSCNGQIECTMDMAPYNTLESTCGTHSDLLTLDYEHITYACLDRGEN